MTLVSGHPKLPQAVRERIGNSGFAAGTSKREGHYLGFLNGIFLFALIGAAIPLIIHLLERRRVRPLPFPSLRFLSEINRRQVRRLNLRRLLLLIVRMLIVILVALALARPTVLGPMAALFPEDTPRAIALIIDRSGSMSLRAEQGTMSELAVARAREVIARLGDKDEVILYGLDVELRNLSGGPVPPRFADELLDSWRCGAGGTRLRSGLSDAIDEMARRPQLLREIYLISDFARSGLDSAIVKAPKDLRVWALPLREQTPANAVLDAHRPPLRPILPGRPFGLAVRSRLEAAAEVEPFPVDLDLGGHHLGSLRAAPAPGIADWREMRVTLDESRVMAGVWRKQPDRFALDDAFFFTLPVENRIRVLLLTPPRIGGSARGLSDHLERALDPWAGAKNRDSNLGLRSLPSERLGSGDLAGTHLVVLASGEINETTSDLLADFVASGGGMLIMPSGEPGNLTRHLLPRLGGPRSLETATGISDRLGDLDPDHPLFSDFNDAQLEAVRDQLLHRIYRAPPGPSEIPASFGSGQPAILAWDHGDGRVRILLFDAGPGGGDLPYSSMYLPLLHEMCQETAGSPPRREAFVGDNLVWSLPELPDDDALLQVLTPDGRLRGAELSGDMALLERAELPGIYRLQLRRQGRVRQLGLMAVNPPPAESKLIPISPDSLPPALGIPQLAVIGASEDAAPVLTAGRFGREIGFPILIVAALLMILELWLGRGAVPASPTASQRGNT